MNKKNESCNKAFLEFYKYTKSVEDILEYKAERLYGSYCTGVGFEGFLVQHRQGVVSFFVNSEEFYYFSEELTLLNRVRLWKLARIVKKKTESHIHELIKKREENRLDIVRDRLAKLKQKQLG